MQSLVEHRVETREGGAAGRASGQESRRASRPVRVVYVVSHPIQYQAPLLRRLAARPGVELTVLFGSDFSARGYRDPGFGVEVAWDTPLLEGYAYEVLPALRDEGTVGAWSPISRGVFAALRRLQPDVVWVHGYASVNALQAMVAAAALGVPVLLRAESWLADRERSRAKLLGKALFFRALAGLVAAVLPIGQRNAEYWRHYLPGVPQFLMPYAVDNEWFRASSAAAGEAAEQLRGQFRLGAEQPVILFASKLQRRKRAADLVEAHAGLLARLPATHPAGRRPCLVVVGDGEERAALERQAAELGLRGLGGPAGERAGAPEIVFAGFRNQTELPAFFRLAAVFVLPSQHEPWGLIVNEAMSSGCAVIVSTDVGCHADLMQSGVQGWVYPVGDVAALREALESTVLDAATARRMGEAAQRRMAGWSYEQDIAGLEAAAAAVLRA